MRDIVNKVPSKHNYYLENNSQDDRESVSSTDSGYSQSRSNSSLNSEISKTEKPTYTSYREFLGNYGKKKFSSVAPPCTESKSVKTELIIQVNEKVEKEINFVIKLQLEATPQKNVINFKPPPPPKLPDFTTNVKPKNFKPESITRSSQPDKLTQAKNSVIDEIKKKANERGVVKAKTPYVPQNSYQFTKGFARDTHNTIPRGWKPVDGKKLANDEADCTTRVAVVDGANVSKSDPNVKKLVYNTYRGLLGAYNNKANDIISTLPRSMVVEDKGISRQLNNIALQGGLEHLNGRTNPKESE